jgi:hypothetical protein
LYCVEAAAGQNTTIAVDDAANSTEHTASTNEVLRSRMEREASLSGCRSASRRLRGFEAYSTLG